MWCDYWEELEDMKVKDFFFCLLFIIHLPFGSSYFPLYFVATSSSFLERQKKHVYLPFFFLIGS